MMPVFSLSCRFLQFGKAGEASIHVKSLLGEALGKGAPEEGEEDCSYKRGT